MFTLLYAYLSSPASSLMQEAADKGQAVVTCCHLPVHPHTCPPPCLLWNYDKVLALMDKSGVVVATFAGHTHQNGYFCDEAGVHHIVLPAVLETPPGRDAYGWVEVWPEGLRVRGVDTMASMVCKSPAAVAAAAMVRGVAAAGGGGGGGAEVAAVGGDAARGVLTAAAAAGGGGGGAEVATGAKGAERKEEAAAGGNVARGIATATAVAAAGGGGGAEVAVGGEGAGEGSGGREAAAAGGDIAEVTGVLDGLRIVGDKTGVAVAADLEVEVEVGEQLGGTGADSSSSSSKAVGSVGQKAAIAVTASSTS